jgi:hypothetical protein
MDMLARMRAGWIAPLAALLLAGCASAPRLSGLAEFDAEASPIVAIGYFSHAENLGIESCPWDPVIEIDCWGPSPTANFVVQEVLFGRLPRARLKFSVYDVKRPNEFPLGRGRPVIAYVWDWGPLKYFQELAWTTTGELALPILIESDLPNLPCSGEDLLEPVALEFRKPGPHVSHGVTLAAIREARQKMLTDDDHHFGPCLKE